MSTILRSHEVASIRTTLMKRVEAIREHLDEIVKLTTDLSPGSLIEADFRSLEVVKNAKLLAEVFAGFDGDPYTGQPATIIVGSDRYAAEVTAVVSHREILVQRKGDTNAYAWTLRENGDWRRKGVRNSSLLHLGRTDEYMSPEV